MNNSRGLFALGFLILLFFVSLNITLEKDPVNSCGEDRSCIYEVIDFTNEYSYCERLSNFSKCYEDFSQYHINEDLCFKANNSSNCLIKYAINFGKASSCSETENPDYCIFQVAYNKESVDTCKFAKEVEFCIYSYAIALNSIEYCDVLNENYKNACRAKLLE